MKQFFSSLELERACQRRGEARAKGSSKELGTSRTEKKENGLTPRGVRAVAAALLERLREECGDL